MYRIDPVKATLSSMKKGDGIDDVSDRCYSICADFEGTASPWNSEETCAGLCDELVNKERLKTFGLNKCNHRWPDQRGVVWNQSPNYFPDLYAKYMNVDTALAESYKLCDGTQYPKSCREKALMQSNAVCDGSQSAESPDSAESAGYKNGAVDKRPNMIALIVFIVIILLGILFLYLRR